MRLICKLIGAFDEDEGCGGGGGGIGDVEEEGDDDVGLEQMWWMNSEFGSYIDLLASSQFQAMNSFSPSKLPSSVRVRCLMLRTAVVLPHRSFKAGWKNMSGFRK